MKQINGSYYLESEKVKVFPCAYRGENATDTTLIDPEARLNTEFNFANMPVDFGRSYITNYSRTGEAATTKIIINCVIGGYRFELTFDNTDFNTWQNYACINLKDINIAGTGATAVKTKVLANLADTTNDYLDQTDSGKKYFMGICFRDDPTGYNAYIELDLDVIQNTDNSVYGVIDHTKVISTTTNQHITGNLEDGGYHGIYLTGNNPEDTGPNADYMTVFGRGNHAYYSYQTVVGPYANSYYQNDAGLIPYFVVGNGDSNSASINKSNAFMVFNDGTAKLNTTLTLDATGSEAARTNTWVATMGNVNQLAEELSFLLNYTTATTLTSHLLTTVWTNQFKDRTTLTSINFPNVTAIQEGGFSGCTGLCGTGTGNAVSMPKLVNIGKEAFKGCSRLPAVSSASNCTVSESSFSGCTNLAIFTAGTNLTDIPTSCFYGCTNLQSQSFDYSKLVSIGAGAFANCINLTSTESNNILQNITSNKLGTGTFNGCTFDYIKFKSIDTTFSPSSLYGLTCKKIDLSNSDIININETFNVNCSETLDMSTMGSCATNVSKIFGNSNITGELIFGDKDLTITTVHYQAYNSLFNTWESNAIAESAKTKISKLTINVEDLSDASKYPLFFKGTTYPSKTNSSISLTTLNMPNCTKFTGQLLFNAYNSAAYCYIKFKNFIGPNITTLNCGYDSSTNLSCFYGLSATNVSPGTIDLRSLETATQSLFKGIKCCCNIFLTSCNTAYTGSFKIDNTAGNVMANLYFGPGALNLFANSNGSIFGTDTKTIPSHITLYFPNDISRDALTTALAAWTYESTQVKFYSSLPAINY